MTYGVLGLKRFCVLMLKLASPLLIVWLLLGHENCSYREIVLLNVISIEFKNRNINPSSSPQGIERKIREEYEACNNEEYKAARRRWFYLQNKLQYVKALVRRWQTDR